MKLNGLTVAATALLGLAALKLMFPQLGAETRAHISQSLAEERENIAVFRELGGHLKAEASVSGDAQGEEAAATSAQAAEAGVVLISVPSPTPAAITDPAETLPAQPEEALAETAEDPPVPAAVAAFLESQKAFSDYALPEKVDYAYVELPFAYSIPVTGYNSSGFGYRLHPILNTVRFHYGTDFAAFSGERILAFTDGTVSFAGYDESYGYHIRIDHGDGWETLYAHCSAIYVSSGQHVAKGECIALVGETGLATGPHLHFELTHAGKYLNPEYYING